MFTHVCIRLYTFDVPLYMWLVGSPMFSFCIYCMTISNNNKDVKERTAKHLFICTILVVSLPYGLPDKGRIILTASLLQNL